MKFIHSIRLSICIWIYDRSDLFTKEKTLMRKSLEKIKAFPH